MSYKDITPGRKKAKAKSARIVESKTGKLAFEIAFEFIEESTGGIEFLTWQGWITPNAIENTMKTMVEVLQFNGNDQINSDGTLRDHNAINFDKEVALTVEDETYEGKTRPKIKWVNNIGGYAACEQNSLKDKLNAVGFTAVYLAAKQKSSERPPSKKEAISESALPF